MPSIEKWKTIKDFEGYEVSDRGRIRNKKTGHVLSNTRTGGGYLKVNLGTGPKCTKRVNRLVAFAFSGRSTRRPRVLPPHQPRSSRQQG